MTVLVTGGAGFVGMNVVEALIEHGHDVVLFDSGELPAEATQALEPHRDRLAIERGSVLDPESLHEVFRKHRIERVIHAAAITSGPEREAWEPTGILDVNVRGTIEVIEAARKHGVKRTIYVGSGAAYGESLYRLPRLYEESPSVPTTFYSITKHAAERACMRLKALWGIDVVCVRLGTVIGPWERDTGARDNFGTHSQLAGMAAAGKTAILTEREIQRDWIYTRDVAAGLVALVGAPALRHTVYNLSSGVSWEKPIASWCERLREAYPAFTFKVATPGEQANIWYTDRDRGIMDIGRISQDVGFRIRYPMQRAYDDFLERLRKKNPDSKAGGNRGG